MKEELFDLSEQYEEMLRAGIRLSGEDQNYFIAGRFGDLRDQLPRLWQPRRVLDFGCGIGHSVPHFAKAFPGAELVGADTSEAALAQAEKVYRSPLVSFRHVRDLRETEEFDLCYANGVFHHIHVSDRPDVVRRIYKWLAPGGYVSIFENNPWNPGTRMVMRRIVFDRDAVTLSAPETRRLVRSAGFSAMSTRFLFYYPRAMAWLRFTEPWLAGLPLGAQYYVLAVKS